MFSSFNSCFTGLEKDLKCLNTSVSCGLVALRFCLRSAMACFFFAFLFMTQLAKKFRKPFPSGHDVEKLPAPQENQLVPELRRVLFVSPFFLYRYSWLSRDVIAAIVDDMKEGFLTKFVCLCHAGSPPGHSHLTLSVLDGNRQSSRTLPFLICILYKNVNISKTKKR